MHNSSSDNAEEYDSTWEGDDDNKKTSEFSLAWFDAPHRNVHAARDMQNYRHKSREILNDDTVDIEKLDQEKNFLPNLWFYQNKMESTPDGVYIDQFYIGCFGNYKRLEEDHNYIQWLFPIPEKGLNNEAYLLSTEEVKLFHQDEEAKQRLLTSYRLMLDFYGIELLDEKSGKVGRSRNWKERFENLNRNTHNNFRITRILKCLGLLGFQHYQAPLVKFFLLETLVEETLPKVKLSVLDYFMFAVLDKTQRKELIRFAFHQFKPRDKFVWCPKNIQRRLCQS